MPSNSIKKPAKSQEDWLAGKVSALSNQYDLIPCRSGTGRPVPYEYGHGEKYPADSQTWKTCRQDVIGIRLGDLVLIDWDMNKNEDRIKRGQKPVAPLVNVAATMGMTEDDLWGHCVQWNDKRDSVHFLFHWPEGFDPEKYNHAKPDKPLPGVDLKTGNQLVYIKFHKEDCFDGFPTDPVPVQIMSELELGQRTNVVKISDYKDDGWSLELAAELLTYINPDIPEPEWWKVINGTIARFGKTFEAIKILDTWSKQGVSYKSFADLMSKVDRSNEGGGTNWGSVVLMAQENGYIKPRKPRPDATEAFKGVTQPVPQVSAHVPMMIDHHGYETRQTRAGAFPTKTRANLEKVLDNLGIVLAINSMTQGMDVLRGESYDETKYEVLYSEIVDQCERTGLPLATIDLHIKATALKRSYHPIEKALYGKQWDGIDRVLPVLACMPCENPAFRDVVMRKWLISAMAAIYVPNFFTKLVPVIKGVQTSYKTSFLDRVCSIVPNSFANGQTLDTHDTDSIRSAVSKHVIELGEMESTTKKDMGQLKSFITRTSDAFRVPYDKSETIKPRQTVFIGSVNVDNFLRDSTGNDRFPVIELAGRIDIDKVNEILGYSYVASQAVLKNPENLIQFWLQVKHWLDSGERWDLTTSELELSASINSKYESPLLS